MTKGLDGWDVFKAGLKLNLLNIWLFLWWNIFYAVAVMCAAGVAHKYWAFVPAVSYIEAFVLNVGIWVVARLVK